MWTQRTIYLSTLPVPPSGGPGTVTKIDMQALDGAGSIDALREAVVNAYGTKLGSRQLPTDDN